MTIDTVEKMVTPMCKKWVIADKIFSLLTYILYTICRFFSIPEIVMLPVHPAYTLRNFTWFRFFDVQI